MSAKSKIFFFSLMLLLACDSKAQDISTFSPDSSRTLTWLNDTLFGALLTNNYDIIRDLYPSRELIDTLLRKKHPELDKSARSLRYAKIYGTIHRQYRLFRKKIKKSDFVLRRSTLDSTSFGTVIREGDNPYCEVTMFCSRKNSEFEIEYIALEIMGQWCIVEKLAFMNLRKKPKKAKNQSTKTLLKE